jgi:hypothetical protein
MKHKTLVIKNGKSELVSLKSTNLLDAIDEMDVIEKKKRRKKK